MKVGGSASFNNAVLEGPVQFIWTDIAGDFNAISAKFQSKYMAMFARMKVRGSVNCRKASFEGPTSFGVADISWLTKRLIQPMCIAVWKSYFYAKATAPMQKTHSLQEKFGSDKNTFAAVTG